ncbi:isochorismatase domain-containing protein 1 isoform X4 [Phocoena sinus]|uniref:isochorismatase domain-containing protein 1 isoform X4 n=1 Tax=Phocoena sinus TaxID=42100 RepID=UPI0013C3F30A|nr:isochorismatase domain-containing protein 1 isoform X4 [Phocoena sinus]
MRASHRCGLSRYGAQAPDVQAQRPWLTGPAAPRHVGSSQTGARTHVPCISRWTPNHCATREAWKLTTLGNLTPSSTVFFCCDMQERFRPAIKYFGDIISVGQRLLQGARILGIPVIVTEQYPKGLGSTVQEIDLAGVKLVLPKTKFSMVLPEVEAALAEIPGVRSVVLFGVETHVCIQQTALELVGRGIEVHIVADATSSRSMMDRMFALERLARTGIIVTTSEAVLLQLVADKDHPKFKEIQNLIKASAPESGLLSKV